MEIPESVLDMQEVQKRRSALKWKKRARFWGIGCGAAILVTLVVLFSPVGPWRGMLFPATSSTPEEAPAPLEDGNTASGNTTPPPVIPGGGGAPAEKASDLRPPCVAIVVDDVGNGNANMGQWLAIDAPLSFAIMPYYPDITAQAEQLHQAGFQVMLHIPTANKPPGSFSGKGQIESAMDQATVFSTLDTDVAQIPFAVGINNHQGGAGCDDLALMTRECEWALQRGFFVVDSNSSVKPQVAVAAVNLGLGKKKNQVFLDHDNNPDYIRQAMRNLADLARKNGYAIGICHWMRPNTPSVVGEMVRTLRAEGINFAFVQYVNN
jgi:polysaccharide deacetylase 2 family uncharacterized protein YibQ